jgi:hypothetical protein
MLNFNLYTDIQIMHWQTLSHNVVSSTPRLSGFELTTLVVMCTDCIGSYKSHNHTITTAPIFNNIYFYLPAIAFSTKNYDFPPKPFLQILPCKNPSKIMIITSHMQKIIQIHPCLLSYRINKKIYCIISIN